MEESRYRFENGTPYVPPPNPPPFVPDRSLTRASEVPDRHGRAAGLDAAAAGESLAGGSSGGAKRDQ